MKPKQFFKIYNLNKNYAKITVKLLQQTRQKDFYAADL